MKWVSATCSDQLSGASVLFETLDSGLLAGLLASPALVQGTPGTVYVPVVNVGTNNVVLYPCTRLGQVSGVDIAILPQGVFEV